MINCAALMQRLPSFCFWFFSFFLSFSGSSRILPLWKCLKIDWKHFVRARNEVIRVTHSLNKLRSFICFGSNGPSTPTAKPLFCYFYSCGRYINLALYCLVRPLLLWSLFLLLLLLLFFMFSSWLFICSLFALFV